MKNSIVQKNFFSCENFIVLKKTNEFLFFKKMDFSVLILTIGVPGSGKSTWCEKYKKEHPNGTYIISTDTIRKEMTGVEQCIDPNMNSMIHEEARKRAKDIISKRKEIFRQIGTWPVIIIDSTNTEVNEWYEYKKLNPGLMKAKLFGDVTPELAFERIKNRERKVPLNIIQMKWDELQKNLSFLKNFFNIIE